MSLSPDSSFSAPPADISSNIASSKSTPPTTDPDSASLHSDTSKHDVITVALGPPADSDPAVEPEEKGLAERKREQVAREDQHENEAPREADKENDDEKLQQKQNEQLAEEKQTPELKQEPEPEPEPEPHHEEQPSPGRMRRATRGPPPVYNLAKLIGTDGHGKRRAKGDIVSNRRRRTIGAATVADIEDDDERKPARSSRSTIDALNLSGSPQVPDSPRTRRQAKDSPRPLRSSSRRASAVPSAPSSPNPKRGRAAAARAKSNLPRELRNLQDTKEFAHLDEKPVVTTVWSNGKYVDPREAEQSAKKKSKATEKKQEESPEKESSEPVTNTKKRRVKKYLDKGLYAGQDAPLDIAKGLTPAEKKKLAALPELIPSGRVNKALPAPMYNGLRTLIAGRDFKLPFHVCNPLPPGQPKPDEWKKMTKNRFIGESKDIWRKSPHFHDYQSKCVCKPEDGCGESCQNRIMLYECDEQNCNVGRGYCTNRAFANLGIRRAKGGKYRVGVEVIKTSDRGYGVRSNRCFKPNQIIMEYAGEIITEEECERRMNEVYKDNECYYLMSFDQNMIIDATTGSIARFVNHSCNPNCRMVKWIVSGQPRMALFAGDKPIMTGDELTYDYNFDPFSAKNVQKCLCGEPNCRGVLGPKPKEMKLPKPDIKKALAIGKRKLKDFMGSSNDAPSGNKNKKPRITSTKGALANVGLQVAKGTATALRKGMNTVAGAGRGKKGPSAAKKPTAVALTVAQRRAKTSAVVKKTATNRVVKAYGKTATVKKTSARSSTSTVVAKGKGSALAKKTAAKKSAAQQTAAAAKKAAEAGQENLGWGVGWEAYSPWNIAQKALER